MPALRNRAAHHPTTTSGSPTSGVPRASKFLNPEMVLIQRNLLCWAALVLAFVLILVLHSDSNCHKLSKFRKSEQCEMHFSDYKGHSYYNKESGSVGTPKCLVESKWMKVSQHSVKFPGSNTVFDDWLWIDYHDRINVLVEDQRKPGEERKFLVFEQSKYALEGRSSLAIIGGVIEPGEEPETAARREVDEEMNGLQCRNFHFLGRYRTDVNRGMGWLNGFLATDCSRETKGNKAFALAEEEEVGAPDTERQDLKSISLSRLREAIRQGGFLEVQWTMTVSLALLHPELME